MQDLVAQLNNSNPNQYEDAMTEIKRLRAELINAEEKLREIGDYAHDHSTGPEVPDALWTVREMAYELLIGE